MLSLCVGFLLYRLEDRPLLFGFFSYLSPQLFYFRRVRPLSSCAGLQQVFECCFLLFKLVAFLVSLLLCLLQRDHFDVFFQPFPVVSPPSVCFGSLFVVN